MSIFFRYVFRQSASALLLILASLGGIVWIALALKQLNVVTSQGQDAFMLFKMTTLALPNLLAIIAPFALLISALHILNRLNGDSELIVMTAAGANVWTVARPLIALGLLVTVAVSFVNHVGMPWSLRLLREYIVQMRTDLLSQVMQPGSFTTPEKGLTFHIRAREFNGDILGLVVNDNRNKKEQQTYLAKRGQIVKQDPTAYLIMYDGHILRRTSSKEPAQIIVFDKYIIDLDRLDQGRNKTFDLKPRERYLHELTNPKKDDALFAANPGQFRAELHERFANPLYPITFILIALAAAGQAQSTRQARTERMVIGFVSAVACRMGGLAVNNLVALNAAFVPLLYVIPLAASSLAAFFIIYNARPRKGLLISDRLEDLLKPIVRRLQRPNSSLAGTPPGHNSDQPPQLPADPYPQPHLPPGGPRT
ncbi:MAG: LPS export ABC transporter permease LptF [Alphaproteobacteria bacterium]|nr:LPS export ABC transporter permease LptF [Alphaproteobacteria bacterium]